MSVLLAAANCKLVCCRTIKDHVGRALCLLSDVTRRRYLSATRLKGPRGDDQPLREREALFCLHPTRTGGGEGARTRPVLPRKLDRGIKPP